MTLHVLALLCVLGAPALATEPDTVEASSVATSTAPLLSGLAVAADNPAAAPVVSFTIEPVDAEATVWWRAPGLDWTAITTTRSGAFRFARLPEGVQQKGFAFFVEATAGGQQARTGTRASPIEVPPAVEGNLERVARDARDAAAFVGPHPAFVMIALGTGVVAGAGAGAFGWDLQIVQRRLAGVDAALSAGPDADTRQALRAERTALGHAVLQDTVAVAVLGTVAGVALVTGVTLLVIGAVEQ
jgi:hypothetical protein